MGVEYDGGCWILLGLLLRRGEFLIQVSNEAGIFFNDFANYPSLMGAASGLLIINHQGKITYVNNTMLEILGLPAKEVLGFKFISLLAGLIKKPDFLQTCEWLRHTYQPDAYLISILNGHGKTIRLKVTIMELADTESILIFDRCERPAYDSQTSNLIIEQLPLPLISIDSKGKINLFNLACEHLTQLHSSDLCNQPIEELEKTFPELASTLLQTLYEAQPLCKSVRLNRSTKSSMYIKLETRPIIVWGRVKGAVACLYELPETLQRQGLRRQNLDFISDLVEETAHRVRNPLTVLKGFIQLYKDNPKNIPWDLLLDEVSDIERTLQNFMMLSQNYRDKSERVNLNQIIAELYPAIETTARQQGVWIELYLDKSLVNIRADSNRIKALINHLTASSLYAMPSGGILTISTILNKDNVILQVADSGMSMSEELDTAFKPFYSTSVQKAGLGLTVCEHVVGSLGGSIHLNNNNQGTVVTVTIPRATGC